MKRVWKIKTRDGRIVKVKYNSRYFSEDSICPHLEFNGYAVSETGYRSHFFSWGYKKDSIDFLEPKISKVKKLVKFLIKDWFLPPQQIKLELIS